MATKAQLEALAKGREKLAKSRKLNGLKDLFKKKSNKKTKPDEKKMTVKKSSKKQTSAKKTVRKALTETKKKVRKTTNKIFSNARKKAVKETNKALASTKKLLQKKGLAGNSNAETIKMLEERLNHQKNEVVDAKLHTGEAGYPKEYVDRMIANCKQTQKLLKQYKSK